MRLFPSLVKSAAGSDAADRCPPGRRARRGASPRRDVPPTCRITVGFDDVGDVGALRLPGCDAVSQIRSGLAREERALADLREARERQIAPGIRLARERDGASWWSIATSIIPGGRGQDPADVHQQRLKLAIRLRQRQRIL